MGSSRAAPSPTTTSASLAVAVALSFATSSAACRDDGARGAGSGASSVAPSLPVTASGGAPSPTPAPSAPSLRDEAVEDELSTRPMELLRFRFTSGVDGREPKAELDHAKPGQRVYGYLALRNRTGKARTVTLSWKVNGEARTTTELAVEESWQFRTWGYNTLLPKDKTGTLELEVTDDAGHSVVEKTLPIRP